jgi:hypothetical protein
MGNMKTKIIKYEIHAVNTDITHCSYSTCHVSVFDTFPFSGNDRTQEEASTAKYYQN